MSPDDGGTINSIPLPHRGNQIHLADGTDCIVDRVCPPPAGSHIVAGTVHATRAEEP